MTKVRAIERILPDFLDFAESFPETVDGMVNVCYCRHALSLDDPRGKFLPEYVNGGAGPAYSRTDKKTLNWMERERSDRVKEVWFVESHSDMYDFYATRCVMRNIS